MKVMADNAKEFGINISTNTTGAGASCVIGPERGFYIAGHHRSLQ